jgi:dipeptidyl aminopeptidase/acylaminoacyl peptidase
MRLARALPLVFVSTTAGAQLPDVAPNENLIAEGIPAIPGEVAGQAARYTDYRTAILWDWHPTKRDMLIGTRFADVIQAHAVRKPGGARTQLTFFPERLLNASYQPTTGSYFVFQKDVGGNEFNQLYRYDLANGDVTLLTDGKSKNDFGAWSTHGNRLVYTSTRRNGKDTDFWVIDPEQPKSDNLLMQAESGGWQPLDWSPDDKKILALEYVSINESFLWLVDAQTGKRTPITRTADTTTMHSGPTADTATMQAAPVHVSYGGAVFSKDGKGLYVTTDRGSEYQRLAYIDLATGKHSYLTTQIPWDVESFALSHDGATLAFVINEDGISKLHLLDTKTRRERRAPKVPTGIISALHWHRNSRDLGFDLTTARAPTDAFSFDVRTSVIQRWTTSEIGVDTTALSPPELVRWRSFDGRTISGFLYRPPARFTGKRPVIVNIHGGPEGQSRPGFLGRTNYLIAELGVAILFPNVRGSTGYGKTFLTLDNGMKREDSYRDINALFDWIATRPDLDASKVMVTGGSYGGHMTLAVATYYPDRISCAVDVVGISNLATFLEHTESYRRDLRRAEYGDERDSTTRAFMERTAPLNNASKITKPLFVVAGANDPRVPRSESEQIVTAVRKSGTPVWYLVGKDEGHGFAKKRNLDYQFYATTMFVRQYLLGGGATTLPPPPVSHPKLREGLN